MPYQIINYLDAFIIAIIATAAVVLIFGKWKKIGFTKVAIVALVLSVVNDISYLIFSYITAANFSNSQKSFFVYANLAIMVLVSGFVCMAAGRKYLRINANDSVVFAVVYLALFFVEAIFLAPWLFGFFTMTGLFKV